MRGEKVAAVVMANDQAIRLAGEEALARELSARGAEGVPMYTLLAGADPDEAKARAAAERAESRGRRAATGTRRQGNLVDADLLGPGVRRILGRLLRPRLGFCLSAAEIRTDTIIIVETLVYSLHQNKLVWSGQSKTTNPANLNRLIENTAKRSATSSCGKDSLRNSVWR